MKIHRRRIKRRKQIEYFKAVKTGEPIIDMMPIVKTATSEDITNITPDVEEKLQILLDEREEKEKLVEWIQVDKKGNPL